MRASEQSKWFKPRWQYSLGAKFAIITIAILAVTMTLSAYIQFVNQRSLLNKQLEKKGQTLGYLTSEVVKEFILAYDMVSLEKHVVSLTRESDVVYAAIYSSNNDNLTKFLDTDNPLIQQVMSPGEKIDINTAITRLKHHPDILHMEFPVIYNEFVLGRVVLGMNRLNVIAQSRLVMIQQLTMSIIIIIVLCSAIFILFRISTLGPIRRLVSGLHYVSEGNLGYRITVNTKDELGVLTNSFNEMVAELNVTNQQKDDALEQLRIVNSDLESDVEASSQALDVVNKELEYLAMHDTLTHLPNRHFFFDKMQKTINVANRTGQSMGLIMMDLDRFKEINDALGHDIGDQILIHIGRRLDKSLREHDCVGRLGGDEFVMMVGDITLDNLVRVAEKITSIIEPEVTINERPFYITASMGLALYPEHADNSNDLLRCADMAMYEAKRHNKDFTVYEPGFETKQIRHMDLLGGLRTAIRGNHLFLQYQPKIDMHLGKVTGVEALVRWQHPEKGVIPPYEFIGLAENTGLIKQVTDWVVNEALRQGMEWSKQGLDLTISINLSMLNLHDEAFPLYVKKLLQKYDYPAEKLILEVTETAIMSNTILVMGTLTNFSDMGIRISIDDFGTGYSSLAYLHKLPVDEVKIDQSFVMDMARVDADTSIVLSIIELGHNLGLEVVAEGVESKDVLNKLSDLHCDMVQGYYFSVPLAPSELEAFCNKSLPIKPAQIVGSVGQEPAGLRQS